MQFNSIIDGVRQYYNEKIVTYGATAKGVDWNSPQSQTLRFEQLLKICDRNLVFSINDYGCGYGALVKYMTDGDYSFQYRGFEISGKMCETARELYGELEQCCFFTDEACLTVADYTVASGIFNIKLDRSYEEWEEYVLAILEGINHLSKKGFAFNMLTQYSDREHMKDYLYYADPCVVFDHCKRNYSKNVALLHDYGLYEFTILVKKYEIT
ncbi:MAG: class I SAM-dependent methyltransferase [Deltaproteobacteria bacterium]|nr:class I SAM-dependent methyltransferase [Deltaproteobacteria bacterium]